MSTTLDQSKATLNKSEAAFYGQFVAAVVDMYNEPKNPKVLNPFDTDPQTLPPAKNIPAGWELSAWIVMSDFLGKNVTQEFYGIVVYEIANPDNRIVAIRGTQGLAEWVDDADSIFLDPFPEVPGAGKVARGFHKIYSTIEVVPVSQTHHGRTTGPGPVLQGSFGDQLAQLAAHEEAERGVVLAAGQPRTVRPTVVTGHSLGSALATLFAIETTYKKTFDISVCSTLASPAVGDKDFAKAFNDLPITSWRIFNSVDDVPKQPPAFLGFTQVDTGYSFDSSSFAQPNEGCRHSIYTYMHWLDNSVPVAADCAL